VNQKLTDVYLCDFVFCVCVANLPFLLYAKESQIRSLELDATVPTASHGISFQPVVISNEVISMDFDSTEGYVYWLEQQKSRRGHHFQVWRDLFNI